MRVDVEVAPVSGQHLYPTFQKLFKESFKALWLCSGLWMLFLTTPAGGSLVSQEITLHVGTCNKLSGFILSDLNTLGAVSVVLAFEKKFQNEHGTTIRTGRNKDISEDLKASIVRHGGNFNKGPLHFRTAKLFLRSSTARVSCRNRGQTLLWLHSSAEPHAALQRF